MVEKHLTLRRADGGPDSGFSMEPQEFKQMVDEIRILDKALGSSEYRLTPKQEKERAGSPCPFFFQLPAVPFLYCIGETPYCRRNAAENE